MILKYITNVTNLDKVSSFQKLIFLMTNLIYFLPIFFYGIHKTTFLIMLIGFISLAYHSYQCKCSTNPVCKYLLISDCIIGTFLAFLVLYITIGILAFIFLLKGNNDRTKETYIFLHSMWHLITGFILLYIAKIDSND